VRGKKIGSMTYPAIVKMLDSSCGGRGESSVSLIAGCGSMSKLGIELDTSVC